MLTLELLTQFEKGLNPRHPERSAIPAKVVGFGEISAIFELAADKDNVYKRLPLFENLAAAQDYVQKFLRYCELLEQAGLNLPPYDTRVVAVQGRPFSLYLAQKKLSQDALVHRQLHQLGSGQALDLIEAVIGEIAKVWTMNTALAPGLQLAIDGQLSNWARAEDGTSLYYIDTSTPIFRCNGEEQLDPELLLKSAPGFLRWIIRRFFLSDVMARYYVPRLVLTDLVANLYKEQKMDLIDPVIELINGRLPGDQKKLTRAEVDKYYREDKLIWQIFLAFRQMDRFIATRLRFKRYEFILPGKIKR